MPTRVASRCACLAQLLAELRDIAAVGFELAARVQHLDQRALARAAARLGQIDIALVLGEQRLGGGDPCPDRGDQQHLVHDLAGHRQMRRLGLAKLRFGLCARLFDPPAPAAEQVEIIGNPAAHRIELELRILARETIGGQS